MEKGKCIECGDKVFGRADKRFCSDNCRSSFNNRLNSDATAFIRNISNKLRKNRRILCDLNPHGKARVHRDELLGKGFNFNYFTNEYRTKSGNVYHFVYDQGYLELDNEYFALVIRMEYVE